MTDRNDNPTGDARTVLPGGICIGTPIPPVPPDPSQIVGVLRSGPPDPDPEYPPIPPAGFYWAKNDLANDEWTVVRVVEEPEGGRWAEPIGYDAGCYVHEWGPALSPPGVAMPAPRLTYVEAQKLKGALGAALLPAPFGGEPEVARKVNGKEHAELEAAIARVTVQPAECRHDAWEWPMPRCPTCGTERR